MPVRLDPFQNIVGVGWPSLVGVKKTLILVRVFWGPYHPDPPSPWNGWRTLSGFTPGLNNDATSPDPAAFPLTNATDLNYLTYTQFRNDEGLLRPDNDAGNPIPPANYIRFDPRGDEKFPGNYYRYNNDGSYNTVQYSTCFTVKDTEDGDRSVTETVDGTINFGLSFQAYLPENTTYTSYVIEREFYRGDNIDWFAIKIDTWYGADKAYYYTGPYEETWTDTQAFEQYRSNTFDVTTYPRWKKTFTFDPNTGTVGGWVHDVSP